MIYKFQPFSTSKQIGAEYNRHCALVPSDDDHILIMDYDAMILDPRAFGIIEEALQIYPQYEILSAVTNRVGYSEQRIQQHGIDKSDGLIAHLNVARERLDKFGSRVTPIRTAAGFFLLFKKSYWRRNPFQENVFSPSGRLFDWVFCDEACRQRKIGMMQGVYVWHTYRLLQGDYREMKHLK